MKKKPITTGERGAITLIEQWLFEYPSSSPTQALHTTKLDELIIKLRASGNFTERVQRFLVGQVGYAIRYCDDPSDNLQLIAFKTYRGALRDIKTPCERAISSGIVGGYLREFDFKKHYHLFKPYHIREYMKHYPLNYLKWRTTLSEWEQQAIVKAIASRMTEGSPYHKKQFIIAASIAAEGKLRPEHMHLFEFYDL